MSTASTAASSDMQATYRARSCPRRAPPRKAVPEHGGAQGQRDPSPASGSPALARAGGRAVAGAGGGRVAGGGGGPPQRAVPGWGGGGRPRAGGVGAGGRSWRAAVGAKATAKQSGR